MMESIHVQLNSVETNLLTWGDPLKSKGCDVIICITGNPGIPHFYEEFASQLNKDTGLPVCVIGQAGHTEVPDKESNVLERREHLYNLEGQVKHKLALINNKLDKSCKIHLIGHSIGAWLILEAIKAEETLMERVLSINLLFPTLQRMAESPNGKYLNNIVRRFHSIAMLLFTLVHILPDSVKQFLISMYLKWNSLPKHYNERISKYLNPKVAEKVLFMAYDEMDKVVRVDCETLEKCKRVTNVIYGSEDGWAPAHYMQDLRPLQPELHMNQVCIDHTFVLKSSETIAELVSDFIKPNIYSSGIKILKE